MRQLHAGTYISLFLQCNVWVYCGGQSGCDGCNKQELNYRAGAGSRGHTFGPYAPGCSDTESSGALFPL